MNFGSKRVQSQEKVGKDIDLQEKDKWAAEEQAAD